MVTVGLNRDHIAYAQKPPLKATQQRGEIQGANEENDARSHKNVERGQ